MNPTAFQLLQNAIGYHQKGFFEQAEAIYREVLKLEPRNADALHLLGLVYLGRQRHSDAEKSINKAIRVKKKIPDYHNSLGEVYRGQGRLELAALQYRKALKLNPRFAKAYNNLGVLHTLLNQREKAGHYFTKAIDIEPDYFEALLNLGELVGESDSERALPLLKQAVGLDPANPLALNAMGKAYAGSGDLDQAVEAFDRAIALDPAYQAPYFNKAHLMAEQDDLDGAIACYQRLRQWQPHSAEVENNLGVLLQEAASRDQAIEHYRKALELQPDYVDAQLNLGIALRERGEADKAVQLFESVVRRHPDHLKAHFSLGFTQLLLGDFADGWEGYEWRWETTDQRRHKRDFIQPLWSGEPLSGKTILLHAEQGLGDTIQFVRYAPLVAKRGGAVVVEVPSPLAKLLGSIPGVTIVEAGEPLPEFDYQCPLLSLPRVFHTELATIPAETPYLGCDAEQAARWKERLAPLGDRFKVGLVWAGGASSRTNKKRKLSLDVLAPLLAVENVALVSLQKWGEGRAPDPVPDGVALVDLMDEVRDFSDTAALIENLDLVISFDTSVAHLAGAMGKETWTLVPVIHDWRWMLERSDSPWYPGMRLFRESPDRGWGPAVEAMVNALNARLRA